jgi:hypothetical protein
MCVTAGSGLPVRRLPSVSDASGRVIRPAWTCRCSSEVGAPRRLRGAAARREDQQAEGNSPNVLCERREETLFAGPHDMHFLR